MSTPPAYSILNIYNNIQLLEYYLFDRKTPISEEEKGKY
jgi:hypothetical protein